MSEQRNEGHEHRRRVRILHISDLHERALFEASEERINKVKRDLRHRGLVLGDGFLDELRGLASDGIDLVCFTGDLADWAHPSEYASATARFEAILDATQVPRDRFFAVPGNHDVQRKHNVAAWNGIKEWLADSRDTKRLSKWFSHGGPAPIGINAEWREQTLERTGAFWDWLSAFKGVDERPRAPTPLGYRKSLPAGTFAGISTPIHILGLDSAWLCGADGEQGQILLTEDQVIAQIRDGERGLDGLRIALVHHPLDHLADHHSVRHLLADGVDILLHGHQHTPLAWKALESGMSLQILAASCLMEGDEGTGWANGFQLIEIDPETRAGAVHLRKWSGEFWAPGSDVYRAARDGILRWDAPAAKTGSPHARP